MSAAERAATHARNAGRWAGEVDSSESGLRVLAEAELAIYEQLVAITDVLRNRACDCPTCGGAK